MTVSRYPLVNALRVIDPGELHAGQTRVGAPSDFWGLANSINCPVGQEPGSAWFLLSRVNGDALGANSFHDLTWIHESGTVAIAGHLQLGTTFKNYVLHRAILQGKDGDQLAPYLCEFRDKRQVFKLSSTDREYNIRRPCRCDDAADAYYTDSLNGGGHWTWQLMFADVWGNLPSAIRGTAPTLPWTPLEKPNGFKWHGVSAWDAVGEILEAMHCRIVLNPVTDVFTVVRIGAQQVDDATVFGPREDLNLSVAPATVRFFFPKRFLSCAQWHDDPDDGGPLVDPFHTIDVATALTGAQAGTVMPVHLGNVAEIAADGTTVSNSVQLTAFATDQAAKIAQRINRGTERGLRRYSGIQTAFMPGAQIHSVTWRDFGDDDGCVTEIRRDPAHGQVKSAGKILIPENSHYYVGRTNGTLDATDCAIALWQSGHPGMSSQIGTIYAPGLDDGVVAWNVNAQVTIYNATPFRFTSADTLKVVRSGCYLVVIGAENWRPYASFVSVGGTPGTGTDTVYAPLPSHIGGNGNVATSSGDTITIACPVSSRTFLVTWKGHAKFSFSVDARNWDHYIDIEHSGTGVDEDDLLSQWLWPGANTTTPVNVEFRTSGFGAVVRQTMSGSAILQLSEGSTIRLKSVLTPSSGTVTQEFYGLVIVQPLF